MMDKILIIDDKIDNLISIRALLRNLLPECEVITAQSGAEGISSAIKEKPDVILLDIIMPLMDGYETCRRLKENVEVNHIPIIMLTAIKTDSQSRIKGLELGADAFLSKPIDPPELTAQVHVMLRIKKAEDKLRSDKAELEKLVKERTKDLELQSLALESAANAIIITDALGDILWANSAFLLLTGFTRKELIGQNPRLIKSGKQDDKYYRELWNTINSGKVWQNEIINKRKDGGLYTEEMTITPLLSDSGEISNFIAIKENITERKKLEEKFFHAEKMETIGHLAGGIAHDFNNILAAIIGKAELSLKFIENGGTIDKNLNQILSSCDRAKHLVSQVLTFSRQDNDIREVLFLKPIVNEVIQMIRSIFPSSIEIKKEISQESRPVFGDATRIHEVIMNLCKNSADSMEGKGELEISLGEEKFQEPFEGSVGTSSPGIYSVLKIKDNGPGMTTDVIAHIFEPFFSTKEIGKGTGLGLSVVFGIV